VRRRVRSVGSAVRIRCAAGWLMPGPLVRFAARVARSWSVLVPEPEPEPEPVREPAPYPRRPVRSASLTSSAAFSPITIEGAFV